MSAKDCTVTKGQQYRRLGRTCRVAGVVDGYVVYRFKGAGMCICYWTDFLKRHVLVEAQP